METIDPSEDFEVHTSDSIRHDDSELLTRLQLPGVRTVIADIFNMSPEELIVKLREGDNLVR